MCVKLRLQKLPLAAAEFFSLIVACTFVMLSSLVLVKGGVRGAHAYFAPCSQSLPPRSLTHDRDCVRLVAKGRVWTGEEALAVGLVDEIGGLMAAVQVHLPLLCLCMSSLIREQDTQSVLRLEALTLSFPCSGCKGRGGDQSKYRGLTTQLPSPPFLLRPHT